MPNPIRKQAVVIGAGMGGLAAAKAVAPHFEKVIVFERDALPDAPASRPGTPQARHTHVLLAGGCRALDHLFPDIELDLVEAGAVRMRARRKMRIEAPGFDPLPQRDLGFAQFGLSRPALERVVRRRVEREPNIEFRPRTRVTELIASPDNHSVAGCASKTLVERREVSRRTWSLTPRGERRQRFASSKRSARRSRRRSRSA
jgi:2-polyprenyl-6-methoxyphenol hydroxylase-like FAD-dependent oxidoreductase